LLNIFQKDILKEWKNDRPIIVQSTDGQNKRYFLTYSAESVTETHIKYLRSLSPAPINFVFPDEIKKILRLPSESALLKNGSQTFKILRYLVKEDNSLKSISIGMKGLDSFKVSSQAQTIFMLVKFYYDTKEESNRNLIKDIFTEKFQTPGSIHLRFSSRNLLKNSLGIENHLIALSEIHGIPPLMIFVELRDYETGDWKSPPEGMHVEPTTRIKNLWRAFKKIKSSDLAKS